MEYVFPRYPVLQGGKSPPPAFTAPRPGGPPAMFQLQRQIGNQAVADLLARPNGLSSIVPEAEAEREALPAAYATLAQSSKVAESLKGSGDRPPMRYWFAKLYEFITEAEIAERGALSHPGFLLSFIPTFYDRYVGNVLYNCADDPGACPARPERTQASAPIAPPADRSRVSDSWRPYFQENKFGDRVVDSEVDSDVDSATQIAPDPRYLVGGYMGAVTVSIFAGVSAHVKGDMANALMTAYDRYRSRYLEAGPFDKYKHDFFEKNRPLFERVREKLVTHLVDIMGWPSSLTPALLRMGDALGLGGPRVDEIYGWRTKAWSEARAKCTEGPRVYEPRPGVPPSGWANY